MEKIMAKNKSYSGLPYAGLLLAAAGVACMVIGLWRGEATEVCAKAVKICLECIGIG